MNEMEEDARPAVSPVLVATTVHGRYLLERPGLPSLLVGFHGYGENAGHHLAELERIPGVESWSLAAVQALHPFYKSRTSEVVASWMTREDREEAIADNLAYVEQVVSRVAAAGTERVVFAGFSQGCAMAYRAAAALAGRFPIAGLLILGGDLPPELVDRAGLLPPVLIGRGSGDEWFSEEKLKKDLRYLGPGATAVRFEGGHVWTDEFRSAAGRFLVDLRAPV
jgi:predicted esterase